LELKRAENLNRVYSFWSQPLAKHYSPFKFNSICCFAWVQHIGFGIESFHKQQKQLSPRYSQKSEFDCCSSRFPFYLQQFVWNEFDEKYLKTDKKRTYYPSVIINERLYELKISDIPVIPYFPVNAYYEWTDYRFYGLRSATAYILVFDLSNVDTFEYIKIIREQLIESRDMNDVPIVIVGNKQDLIPEAGSSRSESQRDSIVSLITQQWNHTYVECSAKFNCKVMYLFKQLMLMIDSTYTLEPETAHLQGLLEHGFEDDSKTKCNII